MALKSAVAAELVVPESTLTGAERFLDSVEAKNGALYSYMPHQRFKPSSTAVGTLCRMYLGREQDHPGLQRGIETLGKWGPRTTDMYYCFYATQALHHWGGQPWAEWNAVMHPDLVKSQFKKGDAAGSWITDKSDGSEMGGRLYTTCLSIMTLEVYYRYMPIYKRKQLPNNSEAELDF
jgi:hypothetical protein